MRCAVLLLLAVHALSCIAGIHKQASAQHNRWMRGEGAKPDTIVSVEILFAEYGLDDAPTELLALANPESPSFGRYWTPQLVKSTFALPVQDVNAILHWVQKETELSALSIWLSPCQCRAAFNATVRQLEVLLKTKYFVYKQKKTGETALICDEYSVPDLLVPLIDFIIPTVFPFHGASPPAVLESSFLEPVEVRLPASPGKNFSKRQQAVDCSQFTTPQCLRDWYNIPFRPANYSVHPNATFGIFQPSWMSWIPSDMDHYFRYFEPHLVGKRPEMQHIAGGYYNPIFQDSIFSLEPNLDFQYAMSLVYPQPVTNIQVGDKYLSGSLNTMLAAYDAYYCDRLSPDLDPQYPNTIFSDGHQHLDCGTHTPPKVISISYAWAEADFPPEYLRRQCNEYLKLSLQGVTILAATGDEGTAGRHDDCPDSSLPSSPQQFHISFPASCPWVTAVGGTFKLLPSSQNGTPSSRETVYNRLPASRTHNTSTGGFSSVFPAPFYQLPFTSSYLFSHPAFPNSTLFNPAARGVPDLSALAGPYLISLNSTFRRVFGTSASTPVVASMFAMINNERMLAGKGPVGFVNPVLYKYHKELFDDIMEGENAGCWEGWGFKAGRGWDAATGMGALDWERLREVFVALP